MSETNIQHPSDVLTERVKRNWEAEIAAASTSAACDVLADDCLKEAIEIESQLEFASVEHDIDAAWLISAKTALKHRKRYHQKILLRKGQLTRAERTAREQKQYETFAQAFLKIARQSLPDEIYREITNKAKAATEEVR